MTDSVSQSELRDIVRELAILGADVRNFIAVQTSMKSEVDALKVDVAELKVQRRITKTYVSLLVAATGGFWWVITQFAEPIIKKILGA
jgi:hypothetical protein